MDDAFLRSLAALQANLSLLDAQSDAFTDLADMKELRQMKSRLADYIAGHAAKGDLPLDPFRVIEERLGVLARFFAKAEKASTQILAWNKSWLKSIPKVGLVELQAAQAELEASTASLPQIQESLRQMLSPLDWNVATPQIDLHPELLLCAECCGDVKLPKDAKKRGSLHGFAHGTGELARRVEKHLAAMAGRIRELVALREEHLDKICTTESHIAAHDFRSAAAVLDSMEQKFTDVSYDSAIQANARLFAAHDEFVILKQTIEEYFKDGEWSDLANHLARLKTGIDQPSSQLGRECLALLASMETHLAAFLALQESQLAALLATRRSGRVRAVAVLAVLAAFATGGGLYGLGVAGNISWLLYAAVSTAVVLFGITANAKAEKTRIAAVEKSECAQVALTIPCLEKAIAAQDPIVAEAVLAELEALIPIDGRMAAWRAQVAAVPGTLIVDLGGGVTMDFMLIRPGIFTMGSDKGGNERAHKVTLTKPFYLGKTEVTQEQWQQVMGGNPSVFKGAKNPVENVSWDDCQEFVVKLRKKVPGQTFRLPTEAEWEYSCRAGTAGDYAGNLDEMAWYDDNSDHEKHPVGQKEPNAWGLHDMHGNVWEWCADWFGDYPNGAVTDPTGPSTGSGRVNRGGAWGSDGADCRSANRDRDTPARRDDLIGFRVAAVPAGP